MCREKYTTRLVKRAHRHSAQTLQQHILLDTRYFNFVNISVLLQLLGGDPARRCHYTGICGGL
ncbi:hypothetical protein OIU76_008852 [Salix suchowensis]|nr:hypothetical protein OIU76_008852 [Salix suchowensis]